MAGIHKTHLATIRSKSKQRLNLQLKVAMLESGLTQREIAARTRIIPETRLSQIVRLRGPRVTHDERAALERVLARPARQLFPELTV